MLQLQFRPSQKWRCLSSQEGESCESKNSTGVIKANFPCRISFRVSSKIDSRTILDANGAEKLLGKGDMLFLPPGSSRLKRLHGPLVTEAEIKRVVSYLKEQAPPSYDETILTERKEETFEEQSRDDELYDVAARLVVERGEASVSFLQRKLKVGYARAARLVDMMEEDGIVGPALGSKVREVLVGKDYFSEVDSQLI